MKRLILPLLIIGSAYATSNADLLTKDNIYCHNIEQDIYNRKLDNSLVDRINDCLQGATYSWTGHGWDNYWSGDNKKPTLEKDGDKYQLQYFKSVDEIDDAVTDINDKIDQENQNIRKVHLANIAKYNAKIAIQKAKEENLKKCRTTYYNSAIYKNYTETKKHFINTRYNNCITNGYDSTTCYSFRLKDSFGYDLEHSAPKDSCDD